MNDERKLDEAHDARYLARRLGRRLTRCSHRFGNFTENRVTFTTGRDISLVPRQAGERLNYFIYPYVEVNGKPLHSKYMTKHFQYRDL